MKFKTSKGLTDPNKSIDMRALHNSFMQLYRKWAGLKTKLNSTAKEATGVKIWNEFNSDIVKIKLQMTSWKSDIEKHKADRSILGFFAKSADLLSSTASVAPSSAAAPSSSTVTAAPSSSTLSAAPSSNNNIRHLSSSSATAKEKPKLPPLQEAAEDTAKEKSLMKQIKEEENNLKRLKEGAKRAETYRKKLKAKRSATPVQAQKEAIFRPGTIEERLLNQGIEISLQDAIVELVTHGGSAEQKRQADLIRSCTTLDSLKENLLKHFNINIAQSTLYTRLLLRDSRTIEGRRHFNCAPVRLLKPQNNLMNDHQDGHFASATIKNMKDLAQIMGPKAVFFLSQDDRARIALGLPAVQNQTRVTMHVQYRIKLPDHDWVVAAKHKLIPSVYASCVASDDGTIGVNGPTYCAIRSGKHDHSGADSHLYDFHRLFDSKEFEKEMKDEKGKLKPILLVTVDGGPDENPRFPKTLSAWTSVFVQYELDMLVVATHAPGQSAYNAVERRMAPLSKVLTGVILPYDTFGSHLNSSHKTVDEELELRNFIAAGESLAEIWNEMSIANYPVVAEFISPDAQKPVLNEWSEQWINEHVLQTQYCLQISKCAKENCCKHPQTSVFAILNGRFLPPPVPFNFDLTGPIIDEKNGHYGSLANRLLCNSLVPKDIVFDSFRPSVKKDLKSRTCDDCGKYFATKKGKLSHRKSKVCITTDDHLLESESEESSDEVMEEENKDNLGGLPIINPSTDPYAYINVFENLTI